MKKVLATLLALSIISVSVPASAAGSDSMTSPASPLRSAIATSGTQLLLAPPAPAAVDAQSVPRTMPRSSGGIRKQGGGKTGMVVGLVSTLLGAAGTYYMIKELKKTTEQAQKQQ